MNILEAIQKVDRSDKNSTNAKIEEFCQELSINEYSWWSDEFDQNVKGYYLVKWHCTDTWVGTVVWFFKDKPVAISHQNGRKSETRYSFIDKECADELRNYILSIIPKEEPHYNILDINSTIDDIYNVTFFSQLLVDKGFYKGRSCTCIAFDKTDYICTKIKVEFDDGTTKIIPVNEFDIPIHVIK